MAHKESDNPLVAEHEAMDEAEWINSHTVDEANPHETEALSFERGADADAVESAESAAIHTDTESALEASGDLESEEITKTAAPVAEKSSKKGADAKVVKSKVVKKAVKQRSQRYLASAKLVDVRRNYPLKDALELLKVTHTTKFDGAVEVHIRLVAKRGKDSGERFRVIVTLPHGTGKEPKIGVLDEQMIADIKQKGNTDFDILLASPALMPKVAQIAKILGPKGKMPNPKTGTVTDDPEAAKRAIISGRVEVRADEHHNLHQMIGRVSWPFEKLAVNYQALLAALPLPRLQRVTLAATMGPGIGVDLKK